MRASTGSSVIFGFANAIVGLCLCGAGAAWAGDGADLGSINTALGNFCALVEGFGVTLPSCPQVPTIT